MRTMFPFCFSLGVIALACGPEPLSEVEARRLIETQPDFTDGVMCGVQVREIADGRYSLPLTGGCLDGLVRAGLVRRAGCVQDFGGGYCPDEEIAATSPARFDQRLYLRFPCGTVSLIGVGGITTTGSEATFSYEREVTLNQELVDSVSACVLEVADAGRATRQRRARRDDDGRWSLVTSTR